MYYMQKKKKTNNHGMQNRVHMEIAARKRVWCSYAMLVHANDGI